MTPIPEGVTLGIAITGVALGILNTWRAFDRDRIKLKVRPIKILDESRYSCLCIEVTNLSFLPVTVSQVEIHQRRPRGQFCTLMPPFNHLRVEPRASIRVVARDEIDHILMRVEPTYVLVKTACGKAFKGRGPALKAHVADLRCMR